MLCIVSCSFEVTPCHCDNMMQQDSKLHEKKKTDVHGKAKLKQPFHVMVDN